LELGPAAKRAAIFSGSAWSKYSTLARLENGVFAMKWNISDAAAALHESAVVCDMVLPGSSMPDDRERVIPRFQAAGCNFVSLTIGTGRWTLEQTVLMVARERARYARHSDKYVLVESVDDIILAKNEGKLAIGFNFQGTNGLAGNLSNSLDMVAFYYKLGVRSILLAYNQKNLVGDGCHEPTNAGLSRLRHQSH